MVLDLSKSSQITCTHPAHVQIIIFYAQLVMMMFTVKKILFSCAVFIVKKIHLKRLKGNKLLYGICQYFEQYPL